MTPLYIYIAANILTLCAVVFYKRPQGSRYRRIVSLLAWLLAVTCISLLYHADENVSWDSAGLATLLSAVVLLNRGNVAKLFNV